MSLIIGLTGGIGSGKSTVSRFFSQLGIEVVDADVVARLVVKKGQPSLAKISDYFGLDILDKGELNRSKLREIIFNDESKKDWLNNLLHPIIRKQMLMQLKAAKGEYVLLEAPLLFENNLTAYCDYVIVVDINESLQIERASARDNSCRDTIKSIMASQIGRVQRLEKADFVIDNGDISLQQLESSVIALDKQLRALQ
ncbi:dephospho-CoA kinase [Psychromonas sp. Urea-02u-13]|uniref:dephospho-CoA kinase n=1 Tax=Psychromonas sp. Urea-02u-13 TaxID=2058326 RepID=UPI000C34164D|nr:dephospho-CoA kinase [Psychromonas sp. Urea-02u-13]PKG38357.1 dephospho-CoA kinase [Psychromonas sp. Urea-02u-13]